MVGSFIGVVALLSFPAADAHPTNERGGKGASRRKLYTQESKPQDPEHASWPTYSPTGIPTSAMAKIVDDWNDDGWHDDGWVKQICKPKAVSELLSVLE